MVPGPGPFLLSPPDPRRARALAEQLGLRPLTAQLLLNRGIRTEQEARRFLDPRLSDLRPPEGPQPMAGFSVAVERLRRAILDRETIGVFGDYDVDGVTTCALLADFLNRAGATVQARVARRGDGYGFGKADAHDLAEAGCSVIITGDCGTSDHETLALCRLLGVDVIIVDHHQVPDRPPEALALLNPHQPGCAFPFKGLASVGVAFYLCAALRTRLRAAGWPHLPDLRDLLDLVAVGTIADLAPLTAENRVLVHAGLKELYRGRRPGLRMLGDLAGVTDGVSSATDVAFRIAPRLNAPGRLGDAHEALLLLIETDHHKAKALAETCHELNMRRQEVQEGVLKEAREQVEELLREGVPEVLVVAGQGWHPGVVGIVAAKLVETYGLPSVVIALDGELGRGSARTAHGFHLFQGLRQAAPLLLRYGGHAAAAGLSILAKNVAALRQSLCASYRQQLGNQPPVRALPVDAMVSLEEVDERLAQEVQLLEPFGVGNPEPTLLVRDAEVTRHRVVGSGHLQVTLRKGGQLRDGIGFGLGAKGQELEAGARVQVAFVPELDTFRGGRRLRLRVRELVPAASSTSSRPSAASVAASRPR
ncbi:MAG: single-stranded-DNA-specific exonuclease RecJ [Myxococcales bacterium]|nr:single-stranded-DNA-specific exonuclease RecJ [Myxococcota bacterium]MDW8283021.1 single-stranded-DNA-specific exonuclease RecJ [Myxococcales bacterium]